ncbi:beta-1,3-glucan-binding protein-like [Diabrotica undecimpunctata]
MLDKMILIPLVFSVILFNDVNSVCLKNSITTASGLHAPKNSSICSGQLIFEDNFNWLDLSKWHHEQTLTGGGNNEFEWYTDDRRNSYTSNGQLHIKPTFVADEYGEKFLYSGTIDLGASCTGSDNEGCRRTGSANAILNPVKSARMRTLNSFSFKYGRVEVSAKVPAGDWLWPAIWLLPSKWVYGSWPTSGEIDMMESRGNRQYYSRSGQNVGTPLEASTLHWGPNPQNNKFMKTHWEKTSWNGGWDNAYHRYQLEWTPEHIKFSVDDQEVGTVTPPAGGFWQYGDLQPSGLPNPWARGSKMAPFDAEFHILINLAVGGAYFPDDVDNKSGKKPWTSTQPYREGMTRFWQANQQWKPTWNLNSDDSHLKVDYVRVWAL